MWNAPENDHFAEEIYLANEWAPPGDYHQVGGTRKVTLEREGKLPASFDGRVACYRRVQAWSPNAMPPHEFQVQVAR